jgi:hypothetical protein
MQSPSLSIYEVQPAIKHENLHTIIICHKENKANSKEKKGTNYMECYKFEWRFGLENSIVNPSFRTKLLRIFPPNG